MIAETGFAIDEHVLLQQMPTARTDQQHRNLFP